MIEQGPPRPSGQAPAPGWWQASDGRWYPPQAQAQAPPQHHVPVVVVRGGTNGFGVAALVLGIIGAVLGFTFPFMAVALICGVLAVIFGAIGLQRARQWSLPGGTSIAGLVLGVIAILVGAYYIWVVGRLFETVSTAIQRSSTAVDASPAGNREVLDTCGSVDARPRAAGSIVNTGPTSASFRVHVRFVTSAGPLEQTAVTDPIAPRASARWTATGVQSVLPLQACVLVDPAGPAGFGAPDTSAVTMISAEPAR
jgi:hypothetical protein